MKIFVFSAFMILVNLNAFSQFENRPSIFKKPNMEEWLVKKDNYTAVAYIIKDNDGHIVQLNLPSSATEYYIPLRIITWGFNNEPLLAQEGTADEPMVFDSPYTRAAGIPVPEKYEVEITPSAIHIRMKNGNIFSFKILKVNTTP